MIPSSPAIHTAPDLFSITESQAIATKMLSRISEPESKAAWLGPFAFSHLRQEWSMIHLLQSRFWIIYMVLAPLSSRLWWTAKAINFHHNHFGVAGYNLVPFFRRTVYHTHKQVQSKGHTASKYQRIKELMKPGKQWLQSQQLKLLLLKSGLQEVNHFPLSYTHNRNEFQPSLIFPRE